MFEFWQTYAASNPRQKNQVPLAFAKLSSWVHEQRKAHNKGILAREQLDLLNEAGFEFHP
jgi:hypothetical protein